eukprot:PLAT9152.6.p1 GENE.PLAT9152.6~~PLAT9152.6.p1  ORF type:complete len:742 (+),score=222.72 PLAT9152.6:2127-4352(+)
MEAAAASTMHDGVHESKTPPEDSPACVEEGGGGGEAGGESERPLPPPAAAAEGGSRMSLDGVRASEAPRAHVLVENCKYASVKRVLKRMSWAVVRKSDTPWTVAWDDSGGEALARIGRLNRLQRISHFPGMSEICLKCHLARNLARARERYPDEYDFTPRAWTLPPQVEEFKAFCDSNRGVTFIVKPNMSSKGRGIYLARKASDIEMGESVVVQEYISRPLLMDGLKFDLRVYALVTSAVPDLRIFVHDEGLARFATQEYQEPTRKNMEDTFMHLTNYSIQRRSKKYVKQEAKVDDGLSSEAAARLLLRSREGSKWSLTALRAWLDEQGLPSASIWAAIQALIVKTVRCIHPGLKHQYRSSFPDATDGFQAFELMGFDILLDEKGKPYLLEVNHSPSLQTESGLDRVIKDKVIADTLVMIAADPPSLLAAARGKEQPLRTRKRLQTLFRADIKRRVAARNRASTTPRELEERREKRSRLLQRLRTAYEDSHLGGFVRVYPSPPGGRSYPSFDEDATPLYSATLSVHRKRTSGSEEDRRAEMARALRNRLRRAGEAALEATERRRRASVRLRRRVTTGSEASAAAGASAASVASAATAGSGGSGSATTAGSRRRRGSTAAARTAKGRSSSRPSSAASSVSTSSATSTTSKHGRSGRRATATRSSPPSSSSSSSSSSRSAARRLRLPDSKHSRESPSRIPISSRLAAGLQPARTILSSTDGKDKRHPLVERRHRLPAAVMPQL